MSVLPFTMRRAALADVPPLLALQHAAFAWNRSVLGVEPLPLLVDYDDVVQTKACWLAEQEGRLVGALILEPEGEALLVWSIAVSPDLQNARLGRQLMAFAEQEALARGLCALILYTGEKLKKNIDWYQRLGYEMTGIEAKADRNIVHMRKSLEAEIRKDH